MICIGGENLVDLVEVDTHDGLPRFKAIPGGSPFNCALALGRLGVQPHYLTPISTDAMGDLIEAELKRSGVNIASSRVESPSSLAVVSINNGQPSYQFYRDNTAERQVTMESLEKSLPALPGIFQVGSLALCDGDDADCWADLFVSLANQGTYCTLDPNVRPSFVQDRPRYMARLERMIARASLVKISDEDLGWLYPDADLETKAGELLECSDAEVLVLTRGSQGALMMTAEATVTVPAKKIARLADTVGAGDTFMAALIYKLHENRGTLDANALAGIGTFAAKAAAINCMRVGCNPPTPDEIQAWV